MAIDPADYFIRGESAMGGPGAAAAASFVVVQMVQTATLTVPGSTTRVPIVFAAPATSTTPPQYDTSSLRSSGAAHTHAGLSVPASSCVVTDAEGMWLLGVEGLLLSSTSVLGPNASAAAQIAIHLDDTVLRRHLHNDDLAGNSAVDIAPADTQGTKLFLCSLPAGSHIWSSAIATTGSAVTYECLEAIQTMVRLF